MDSGDTFRQKVNQQEIKMNSIGKEKGIQQAGKQRG